MNPTYGGWSAAFPEEQFVQLFSEVFGAEKASFLYSQYHFLDIYSNSQYVSFLVDHDAQRTALEIVAPPKAEDLTAESYEKSLLKDNSMSHMGWDVFRWSAPQLESNPERIKEELQLFLGNNPRFREIEDFLPEQRGKIVDGTGLNLREHQTQALKALDQMRQRHETIALLYQATGTGKTVTAVMDAMRYNGRTLFVAHSQELVDQAYRTFQEYWPEVSVGKYAGQNRQGSSFVVCGTVQSVARHLGDFSRQEFQYLIIDEAHHAAADTYRQVLAYFQPKFTLGLTATPERTDERSILEIFKNTAHRLDIQTAVELGELSPVRCFRVHTNIDLSDVRYNSVHYNIHDLEVRLFVPERNQIIVDTWMQACQGKRTVIFCVSVQHAKQISELFREVGVPATAVSGDMDQADRQSFQERFRSGEVLVLCACDLLNEGWDCPEVEVLFMARPTMSRVLYTQQLGRGMRKAPGKDYLMVFDFVDNAGRFNCPYSLHRLLHLSEYHAGAYVAAPAACMAEEAAIYARGEKPAVLLDWPLHVQDYELVDLFNWQEQAEGMLSQMELARRVSAQPESVEKYIQEGKLKADLEVPISGSRTYKYFRPETLYQAAKQFGWTCIEDSNRKDIFMDMVRKMTMTYSYKPVLLKGMFQCADRCGRVHISDLVSYFRSYYEGRRDAGLLVEKPDSLYVQADYTDQDILRNILMYPFRRFETMSLMRHAKTLGILQIEETVWYYLSSEEIDEILRVCDEKLDAYYKRIASKSPASTT